MKRKNQAMLTRQRISLAALNLLSKKKYEDIKVVDICAAAKVSVGAFYHYFKAKEDVFLTGTQTYNAWVKERVEELNASTWREKIEAQIADVFLTCEISNANGIRTQYALWLLHGKSPDSAPPIYVKLFQEYLHEGAQCGEFKLAYSEEDCADLIVYTLRGIVFNWSLQEKGTSFDDIVRQGSRHMNNLLELILR